MYFLERETALTSVWCDACLMSAMPASCRVWWRRRRRSAVQARSEKGKSRVDDDDESGQRRKTMRRRVKKVLMPAFSCARSGLVWLCCQPCKDPETLCLYSGLFGSEFYSLIKLDTVLIWKYNLNKLVYLYRYCRFVLSASSDADLK